MINKYYKVSHGKLEQIYEKHKSMIYGIIVSSVYNKQDVDDLFQEVCVRIVNNCDKFDDPNSVRTKNYIRIIVKNRLRDYFKEVAYINEHKVYFEDEMILEDISESLEETIFKDYIDQQLEEKIKNLNVQYQEIIYLKYVLQLSDEGVGEILGISKEAVRVKVCRTLKRLREQVIDNEEFQKGGRNVKK